MEWFPWRLPVMSFLIPSAILQPFIPLCRAGAWAQRLSSLFWLAQESTVRVWMESGPRASAAASQDPLHGDKFCPGHHLVHREGFVYQRFIESLNLNLEKKLKSFFMCACVNVCVCMCVLGMGGCMCLCICMHVDYRDEPWVSFFSCSPSAPLRHYLSLVWPSSK